MTPTLSGRVQTRLVLLALVGVPCTFLIVPMLPGTIGYADAFPALVVIAVLGVGWEIVYHGMQQLRWDKDWPSILALLSGIVEAIVGYPVVALLGFAPDSVLAYGLYFGAIWFIVWLLEQGPLRVLTPRWRYTGGRLLPQRRASRHTSQVKR